MANGADVQPGNRAKSAQAPPPASEYPGLAGGSLPVALSGAGNFQLGGIQVNTGLNFRGLSLPLGWLLAGPGAPGRICPKAIVPSTATLAPGTSPVRSDDHHMMQARPGLLHRATTGPYPRMDADSESPEGAL